MKKILIIEDDPVVANVHRNKLAIDGYQTEVAPDGEAGLRILRTLQPDLIILDLVLPTISGVEVIKNIRSDPDFIRLPIIVLSNTYLTNLIQDAWKAGANKCLSKSSCTPKDVIDIVRTMIGNSGAMVHLQMAQADGETAPTKPLALTGEKEQAFQSELRQTFIEGLPTTLHTLRSGMQTFIKAGDETAKLKQIYELYRQIHALHGNAGLAGLVPIAHMSGAFEALLKEIYEKPKNISVSTIRTVASAVDFLALLFEKGTLPEQQEFPDAKILVVDDEAISRRAVVYALERAKLNATSVDDPVQVLQLLTENAYDLIFLDVDMPGMSGYEICTNLRSMPHHKKTPVVFVTSINDFNTRANVIIAGGNDYISKPFLFIELTVKALIYILRNQLMAVPAHP